MNLESHLQTIDILTKYDFRHFVRRCFYTLNPNVDLKWNWHLDYMCWLAIRTLPTKLNPIKDPAQRLKRIIINVPPRSLKSEMFSVALTCFIQGHYPSEQMLTASYAGSLAQDLHGKARMVMESEWYRRLFPETELAFSTKTEWKTTANGHRQTVSVGGTTTGKGGNYLIADDIMSADIARSEAERRTANDWFSATFSNRLNDPENGVIIVIMQRLHQDDTTGNLLDRDNGHIWQHEVMPIMFDSSKMYAYYDEIRLVSDGELLFPSRWSEPTIALMKGTMGAVEFAGQYMQTPVPADGVIIPVEKFEYHTEPELPPYHLGTIVLSIDTAIKTGKANDYSACSVWMYTTHMSYLLDIERVKLEYPQMKAWVKKLIDEWQPHTVLIEDKASGQSLLQDLKAEMQAPLKAVSPKDSKVDRATRISPLIEAGNVSLPKEFALKTDFLMECTYFPNGKNDDMLDTMTQYLDWVRTKTQSAKVRVSLL